MTKHLSNWAKAQGQIYVALVILIGVSMLAYYLPLMNPLKDPVLLTFMGLIAFANILAVVYPKSGTYLSLNFPIAMCFLILKGPSGAMWVSLPAVLVFIRRVSFHRILFGICQNTITTYVSAFFVPATVTTLVLTRDLYWMVLIAISADLTNNILMTTFVSLTKGTNWRETFIDLWMHKAAAIRPLFYSTGVLMAVCLQAQGILAALLAFVPALGLFYLLNTQLELQEETAKANTDHLTQIGNRHALFSWWKKEFPQVKLSNEALSVLMIDIDDFKRINDLYGHDRGDMVLREVAQTIEGSLRSTDRIFRYGGEEFVVLLCGPRGRGAEVVANRICRLVSEMKIEGIEQEQITVSVGMADFRRDLFEEVKDISYELLRKSDKAMYLAKKQGKNKVCVYS